MGVVGFEPKLCRCFGGVGQHLPLGGANFGFATLGGS